MINSPPRHPQKRGNRTNYHPRDSSHNHGDQYRLGQQPERLDDQQAFGNEHHAKRDQQHQNSQTKHPVADPRQ